MESSNDDDAYSCGRDKNERRPPSDHRSRPIHLVVVVVVVVVVDSPLDFRIEGSYRQNLRTFHIHCCGGPQPGFPVLP